MLRILAHVVCAGLVLFLIRLQEMFEDVDGQRENDGRILLGRDRVERLQIAQL